MDRLSKGRDEEYWPQLEEQHSGYGPAGFIPLATSTQVNPLESLSSVLVQRIVLPITRRFRLEGKEDVEEGEEIQSNSRVSTNLSMSSNHDFIEVYPNAPSAVS